MNTTLEAVRSFALVVHDGQKDKGGQPYMFHLDRVRALAAQKFGDSDELAATCLLHDAVEDKGVPLWLIRNMTSTWVAQAVMMLTRDKGVPYEAYIQNIVSCTEYNVRNLALRTKWADLHDNLDVKRMQILHPNTREKLCRRYYGALDLIEGRTWK